MDERNQKIAQMGEFYKNLMVELGDTASPSELSHGHNSTYIVSCFNFGVCFKLQETKLEATVAKFSC